LMTSVLQAAAHATSVCVHVAVSVVVMYIATDGVVFR
jgi:hypothetical protein